LKKKYHHGDLKKAVIDSAVRIIEKSGAGALSLRESARMTGVSHAAPYRHFKSKDDLLAAVAVRGFELLGRAVEKAMADNADRTAAIEAMGRSYIDFAVKNPDIYRLMFGNTIKEKTENPALFSAYDSAFRRLAAVAGSGTGKGGEISAMAVWSLLHGYASLVIDNARDRHVGSAQQIKLILKKISLLV